MSTALTVSPMTVAEARDITTRINATAGELCLLLVEAHDREAWRALGYESWKEYSETELRISRQHAYRILDQGRVTLALAAAVSDDGASPTGDAVTVVSERAAREIKPLLPEVTEEIRERVQRGEEPTEVVPAVVESAREISRATREPEPAPKPTPTRKPAAVPDVPEEIGADMAAELEDADRRIRELEAENASLRTDDAGTEIRRLSAKCAQFNATNMGLQRTITELRQQAERQGKVLAKVRKALGVERDSEIVPAIEALQR